MRRYLRLFSGPAVLPLFCLAPHGVFPASRIAPRAVSSYLAFSPLPVPLLPKNRRCLFCDTFRRRDFTIAAPAFFTRHVAVWCSDFPPASRKRLTSDHLPSALVYHNRQGRKENHGLQDETDTKTLAVFRESKRSRHGQEENRNHCESDEEFAQHSAEISQ